MGANDTLQNTFRCHRDPRNDHRGLRAKHRPGMSGTTTSPTQCWDVSSNTVQNRAPGSDMTGAKSGATTGSTAGSATPGTVTPSAPGTVAPGTAGTSGGSSVGGMAQQRPPNMPNC